MSDSDSDMDPDEIEVPGGGKDIHSIVSNPTKKPATGLNNVSVKIQTLQDLNRKVPVIGLTGSNSHNPIFNINSPRPMNVIQANSALAGAKYLKLPNGQVVQIVRPKLVNLPDNEEEGMGVAETYSNYMPLKLKIGRQHPEAVVESTSLSSVEPVNVWYKLNLPDHIITSGALSALQLESITYACQQHQKKLPDGSRGGFLIGDGAGVGKGRTIAGIIYENYLNGRKKAVWVSIMNDLKVDAERDLTDIGASKIRVVSLNKCKYSKLNSDENGNIKKGVIFCTYSSIIARTYQPGSAFVSRLSQLVDWCGRDFDGPLIFDECHKAKNLSFTGSGKSSTKTGLIVLELQNRLPNARVVYASATGATEPKNMAYMVRLGIWGKGTPYNDFTAFINVLQRRGVGAMEIVAMDMKLRGLYISRQLSFRGVVFKISEVNLSKNFRQVYDRSTLFWAKAYVKFQNALALVKMEKPNAKVTWSQFWGAHQRFFKYMCISGKVKHTVKLAREAIKLGKCVVIGLQSTGEAKTLDSVDDNDCELSDFVSTAYGVLKTLIDKHFPDPLDEDYNTIQNTIKQLPVKREKCFEPKKKKRKLIWGLELSDESDSESDNNEETPEYSAVNLKELENSYSIKDMKNELLCELESLRKDLPPNALDELIDELGGPENVAEMTGRKGRVVHSEGTYKYISRAEADVSLETINLMEKQRFMDGSKDVAIISEAASSGISLHSDRRAKNRRNRVHITLELPWSADKAIQQFGRTHRSNQVNAPEYVLLISNLGGERRFASVVAKRLESLGALTQGDRRATEARDLSQFNIDNDYGRSAVEITLKSLIFGTERIVPPPKSYEGDFMKDALEGLKMVGLASSSGGELTLEADKKSIGKFLNRILGLNVNLQNAIFQYFTDTMEALIEKAKKTGDFDLGILDVATSDQTLTKLSVHKFVRSHSTGSAVVELHKVSSERGMAWKEAEDLWSKNKSQSKFYVSSVTNFKKDVLLAVLDEDSTTNSENTAYWIYRPYLGKQVKKEIMSSLIKKYNCAQFEEAQKHWEARYVASLNVCSHKYFGGLCKRTMGGDFCDVGLRSRVYHILSGSVLSVWNTVEEVILQVNKMQVVRVKTSDGRRIVGTLIPNSRVQHLIAALTAVAEKVETENL